MSESVISAFGIGRWSKDTVSLRFSKGASIARCVPVLIERLHGEAEIRRAAAKGICSLMKRAPQLELRKASTVCAVLEALPREAIAMDFLVSVLKVTNEEISQRLQQAACAFLEDCHFEDEHLQEQVEEVIGVLRP
eukprot:s120_g35.t1